MRAIVNALAGLDHVLPLLPEPWRHCDVGAPRTVLGPWGFAGSPRPLPSSAAPLRLAEQTTWIPAPEPPGGPDEGPAALFRHADRLLVLPVIRLFEGETPEQPPRYLLHRDWLLDAFHGWRFTPETSGPPVTMLDRLKNGGLTPEQGLALIAMGVRYALFGSDRYFRLGGLAFLRAPLWLRPAGSTPLARAAARALVVSARRKPNAALPSPDVRADAYRIRPDSPTDFGIDPVHTPEGAAIRLIGRIGAGVGVVNGRLSTPAAAVPLSVSTARLPFAGHNDPRRLLMAANMQLQAVSVVGTEAPAVQQPGPGFDPPGVNLRVGYLAWQGWNHEDAWVLSESAAARLGVEESSVVSIAARRIEMPKGLRVRVGDHVRPGQLLYRRRVAPLLLTDSLARLAALPQTGDQVSLGPEIGDRARQRGMVVRIDRWNLSRGQIVQHDEGGSETAPLEADVAPDLPGLYRAVYHIHLQRRVPLDVGDKLANRHGHKGVVGAILPDARMPRWLGRPLDALIDPTSVLNRSNWGQVYESLAGAVVEKTGTLFVCGASGRDALHQGMALNLVDEHGRSKITPPAEGDWLKTPVTAVAGVQFVMRMPQHAGDRLSASSADRTGLVPAGLRSRSQRFGEMDQWAIWAHGVTTAPTGDAFECSPLAPGDAASPGARGRRLTPMAERLRRLLAASGIDLNTEADILNVGRLALEQPAPAAAAVFAAKLPFASSTSKPKQDEAEDENTSSAKARQRHESLPDLYDRLDQIRSHECTVLTFDPPLQGVSFPNGGSHKRAESGAPITLRWLPLLPACDRPPRPVPGYADVPHELTRHLRAMIRAARDRGAGGSPSRAGEPPASRMSDEALRDAATRYMQAAYTHAVGRAGVGMTASKHALLRRGLLGQNVTPSARGAISPAGPLGLGLDEIGVPLPLANALFGSGLADDSQEMARTVAGKKLWIKRDPVLHRWGLLRVGVRLVEGNTVRLPASLLWPMGADFDGDTVALFAALPGVNGSAESCRPSALAAHDVLRDGDGRPRAMFLPGKQYVYGLKLLADRPGKWQAFRAALRQAGAPDWETKGNIISEMEAWVVAASGRVTAAKGDWWRIVEEHALRGLAADPGMGLGLWSLEELALMPAVACRAAKDLYQPGVGRGLIALILNGKSLDVFQGMAVDPITTVMVAGRSSVGRFGGALRRLVYSAAPFGPEVARAAQALTEQVTQRALSVKAGQQPVPVGEFERQLRRLLRGKEPKIADSSALLSILTELHEVWELLRKAMPDTAPPCLEWLRNPYRLAELVEKNGFSLPLTDDLRLRGWLALHPSRSEGRRENQT
jgi:hypothetical protein